MSLPPGTTLGPYEIVSQLGAGGMGVVYQAHDPRLKRTVAIKLLPPNLTRDETAKQRFLQEAQAASALDHPNICTIYEISETADGQLYLVMAHYEGETLKERISRGPLALDDAIDIATEVGEGLAKAHAAGIVHRDIKPANLMVTAGGTVKILDFGLAKLAGSEGVTQTGTTVGTVAYMSPEQAKGLKVDHRTDIWALGVVLYEMLAGTPPFQGENLLAISNAITGSNPRSFTGSASSMQPVVDRALSRDRSGRYQAVRELLTEVKNLSVEAATATRPEQADVPSIAVLPFTNMSADPDQEYFCDGLAEELIDALARLDGLRVVSRSSAFQFRGKGHDLREVGRKLKVKTVLEGSVRRSGDRLRINAQLIATDDDSHLWSERYDRTMDDVFAVQDDIARAVVQKLRVQLLEQSEEPLVRQHANLEAYELYLRGKHAAYKLTPGGFSSGLEYYEQALTKQPDYAQALSGVAHVNLLQSALGWAHPTGLMPRAKSVALKAVNVDDAVAEGHFASAMVLHYFDWDWEAAEREYRRAIELNSALVAPLSELANFLAQMGRHKEAIEYLSQAIDVDPLDAPASNMLAQVFIFARRYDAARDQLRHALTLEPSFVATHYSLASLNAIVGDVDGTLAASKRGLIHSENDSLLLAHEGWAYAAMGSRREAEDVIERLQSRRKDAYCAAGQIALCYMGLGDFDTALSLIETGCKEREGLSCFLATWPFFDPLRSDPRFHALLRKMNFPQAAPDE